MRTRIYLRIAKSQRGRVTVKAGTKPNYAPMESNTYNHTYHPTVMVALDLEIPDSEFSAARILLAQKVAQAKPAVEIKEVPNETV